MLYGHRVGIPLVAFGGQTSRVRPGRTFAGKPKPFRRVAAN